MDVYEFLKKRNIPVSVLKPVENVLDDKLKTMINTDAVSGFEWYFYKGLDIGESYARARNWDETACVRDLLQNAFDASEDVELYADDEGVHIIDHGSGMPFRAFLFGGEKVDNPCFRGGFGEGLKIALATLTAVYDYPVYIIVTDKKTKLTTAYKVISAYDEFYGERVVYLVVGWTDREVKPHGTHVIIAGMSGNVLKKIKLVPKDAVIFSIKAPPTIRLRDADFERGKYNCLVNYQILDEPNMLYASDLFFGEMTKLDSSIAPPLFGYNIWMTTLYEIEPNRETYKLNGREYTYAKIALLLAEAPQEVWDRIVDKAFKTYIEGKVRIVVNSDAFEVMDLPLTNLNNKSMKKALEKLATALKKKYGSNISYLEYSSDIIIDRVLHYAPPNSTVIILNTKWNVHMLDVLKLIPNFYRLVNKHLEETKKEMMKENLKGTLAYDYMNTLLWAVIYSVTGSPEYYFGKDIDLKVVRTPKNDVEGLSTFNKETDKVEITLSFENEKDKPSPSESVRLIMHELAHALPYIDIDFSGKYGVYNRLLRHNEELYELALQYIAKKIVEYGRNTISVLGYLGVAVPDPKGRELDVRYFDINLPKKMKDILADETPLIDPEWNLLHTARTALVRNVEFYSAKFMPQLMMLRIYNPGASLVETERFEVFPIPIRVVKGLRKYTVNNFGDPLILKEYERIKSGDVKAVYKLIEPTIKESLERLENAEVLTINNTLNVIIFVNPVTMKFDVLGFLYCGPTEYIYADYTGKVRRWKPWET